MKCQRKGCDEEAADMATYCCLACQEMDLLKSTDREQIARLGDEDLHSGEAKKTPQTE